MNINEKISTELSYKDIALIAVALLKYKDDNKNLKSDEIISHCDELMNRLSEEMTSVQKPKTQISRSLFQNRVK